MSSDCYDSFCPVPKACDIIEPRWTLLILCALNPVLKLLQQNILLCGRLGQVASLVQAPLTAAR